MQIYKDYQLIGDTLIKFDVDDQKHLLWKFGGVPCIDAENVWDKHKDKIKKITIRTKKGRLFKIDGNDFEAFKQVVDFGFGKQYYADLQMWDVKEPVSEMPITPASIEKQVAVNQSFKCRSLY